MALTQEQREQRRNYLGSSDSAAVLGLDPFRNAFAVWAEKTGRDPGFAGNEATQRGNRLEPVLLDWAEEELGVKLLRDQFITKKNHPLCANLDGWLPGHYSVEAKTANTATNAQEWGDTNTDQVPERVIIQCHHAMWVADIRLAYVPVLLPMFGRFEFRMYRIERNDDLANTIVERGTEFWAKYVETDTPPPDCLPSLDVLKRMRRNPEKCVQIADDLVDNWRAAREATGLAEKIEEAAQAELIAALGDAEGGNFSRGQVTYLQTHRKSYVAKESTFRTLRLKAAK